ncbi:hypothetical protein Tco_1449439 [Tanacetum coccineum]
MVINSPCLIDKKELAILGQTTTGKEFSNPLMARSLPKTISAKVSAASTNLFWNTATSKRINSVKQIHAIVDGREVAISESSVRSDLLLNDEDEPHVESYLIETPPTVAPQTKTHQTAVSHNIVFLKAHVPTTYQRQRRTHKRRRTKKDTKLPQTSVPLNLEVDNVIPKEGDDNVERDITTDASLDAAQDSDNIIRTQTTAMPNVDIPQGIDKGGSLRRQDTIRGTPT